MPEQDILGARDRLLVEHVRARLDDNRDVLPFEHWVVHRLVRIVDGLAPPPEEPGHA